MAEQTKIAVDEAVSTPPFVDEPEDAQSEDVLSVDTEQDKEDDKAAVDPKSEEGSAALVNSFEDKLSDKIDQLSNKIGDFMTLNKIDKMIDNLSEVFNGQEQDSDSSPVSPSIDSDGLDSEGMDAAADAVSDIPDEAVSDDSDDEPEESTTEQASITSKAKEEAMAMTKKRATDDSGTLTDTQTADEVLNKVVDQDNDFGEAISKSKNAPTPDSANVGDNKDGGGDEPGDTDTFQPVTTASAMRLADLYIKAGVVKEASRYDAVERLSKLSKVAAANQIKAAKIVLAAVKKADEEAEEPVEEAPAEDATPVYDLDGLEAGTITPTDDGYSYDVDGVQGDADSVEEALEAVKDETGNDGLVTSETVASRRRARLRKNLKIAEREARRIQASDNRKATVSKPTKKVARQWRQLNVEGGYQGHGEKDHGRIVRDWRSTSENIPGEVYQREDGTYGFMDFSSDHSVDDDISDYVIEKNGYKTLNEAKNGLLRSLDLAPVSSHASRMSSVDMKAARKAANDRVDDECIKYNVDYYEPSHEWVYDPENGQSKFFDSKEEALNYAKKNARTSVDMKAARKAALAAARKKAAAKTPSIVQRSAAAVKPGFELI